MRLFSTNGQAPVVGFIEALLNGMAPDGGLYLPVDLPCFTRDELESWRGLAFDRLAVTLAQRVLDGELAPAIIDRLVADALDFAAPTRALTDGLFALELFHGPTLAFKDFGARFLARLFGHVLSTRGDHATILVATSGDTGSAVAQGFAGVAGVHVVVLYPAGRVSAFQEAQMATLGGNVSALRVPGAFDDCQRLVKSAFQDPALARLRLSSANSINIGRLLPQSFYYVASYLTLDRRGGDPVVFSVPSGNLGNLTAGLLAARMGVPVARFVAASNSNDVLPEYLETGHYRIRPSVPTLSNAMDVGDPSNFARLSALVGLTVEGLRRLVRGERITDDETVATIKRAYDEFGVVLDPHGAVAVAAACRYLESTSERYPVIALLTAHPAKFGDAIQRVLGFEPALPAHWADWRNRALLASDLPDARFETFRDWLTAT
jgi:threonine synthase